MGITMQSAVYVNTGRLLVTHRLDTKIDFHHIRHHSILARYADGYGALLLFANQMPRVTL